MNKKSTALAFSGLDSLHDIHVSYLKYEKILVRN